MRIDVCISRASGLPVKVHTIVQEFVRDRDDAEALTAMMLLPLVILMEVVLHSIVPKEKLLNMNDVSITRLIARMRHAPI